MVVRRKNAGKGDTKEPVRRPLNRLIYAGCGILPQGPGATKKPRHKNLLRKVKHFFSRFQNFEYLILDIAKQANGRGQLTKDIQREASAPVNFHHTSIIDAQELV